LPARRAATNLKLYAGDNLLADDTSAVIAGEVHRHVALSDPGIDDYRNELLWSPERPTLIYVELKLSRAAGELQDSARNYTALRSIKHQKIESPRYLYWADSLGLLVWEEMSSAYRYTRLSIERLTREWEHAMARDVSHP